jgi:diguanylate cyclase (GGDEF)-like protein/PAS domain S-box-containing protein
MLRWMNDLSIKTKGFLASAILAACLVGLSSIAVITLKHWVNGLTQISHVSLPEIRGLRDLRDRVSDLQLDVFRYVAWSNNSVSNLLLADLASDIHGDLNLIGDELRTIVNRTPGVGTESWISDWNNYSKAVSETVDIARADPPMGTMMLGGTDDLFQRVSSDFGGLADKVSQRIKISMESLTMQAEHDQRTLLLINVFGLAFGFVLAGLIARSMTTPIQAITKAMSQLARGETSDELPHEERSDEIGLMISAISTFREKINRDRQALLTQNMRFDAAVNNMSQALLMFDSSARLVICNQRYIEMYGLSPDVVKPGCTLRELLNCRTKSRTFSDDPDQYIERLQTALRKGKGESFIAELPDGRTIAISNQPMVDGGWVATHEDITERRLAEQQIAHMARHDSLTDLPNRVLFRERLGHGLADVNRGERLAVLYLDLDNFKSVNDTLGHQVGDDLLKAVAGRLRGCVKKTDTVARVGGDEFAIVQTGIGQPSDTATLARRICEELRAPYNLMGHAVVTDTSIGIAIAPNDGTEPTELLKNADMALYGAKAIGRGTYRFFEPAALVARVTSLSAKL